MVNLQEVLQLAKQLSSLDKMRLIQQIAPDIEQELMVSNNKPRKSLWGLCADLGPAPSAEDIINKPNFATIRTPNLTTSNMTQHTTIKLAAPQIESLQKAYIIRDKDEVFEFIESHPYLLPILLEAPEKIRRYFPDEKLGLGVVYDPEIVNYVHLVLSIDLTNLDPYEAMDKEDELYENWLRKLSPQVRDKFYSILGAVDEF